MVVDRRVTRTRNALGEALVSLIRRKPYEAITVEDILQEADVGRSTFYAHFKSKDDLLERGLERLRTQLADPGTGTDPCRALFDHVAVYRDIQLALEGGRGGVIVESALSGVLDHTLRKSLRSHGSSDIPRDLIILHIVRTLNTVLTWWLKAGNDRISAAEADRMFRTLLLGGLPAEWKESFLVSFGAMDRTHVGRPSTT
jgi:AcrR family transcriptional regulator